MDFIMERYVRRIRVLWRFNTITFAEQQAPELSHAHIFQIILKYFSVDFPKRGEEEEKFSFRSRSVNFAPSSLSSTSDFSLPHSR